MRKRQPDDILSKEILNTREAAALLKVTTQTIKNYIYSGRLQALKTPGGHHRIRRQDLQSIGFIGADSREPQSLSRDEAKTEFHKANRKEKSDVQILVKNVGRFGCTFAVAEHCSSCRRRRDGHCHRIGHQGYDRAFGLVG